MKCPACDVPLSMSDRQGIEIDYCPQCRGVWLDRGELDKIIERSSADIPQQSAPPPAFEQSRRDPRDSGHGSGRHDSDHYRRKKKKNLLGELFDF